MMLNKMIRKKGIGECYQNDFDNTFCKLRTRKMETKHKIEIIERHMIIDGRKLNDGDLVKFKYGKKALKFKGYFYISDTINRVFGADFLISDKKREQWKWYDGYLKGFQFDEIADFEVVDNVER